MKKKWIAKVCSWHVCVPAIAAICLFIVTYFPALLVVHIADTARPSSFAYILFPIVFCMLFVTARQELFLLGVHRNSLFAVTFLLFYSLDIVAMIASGMYLIVRGFSSIYASLWVMCIFLVSVALFVLCVLGLEIARFALKKRSRTNSKSCE